MPSNRIFLGLVFAWFIGVPLPIAHAQDIKSEVEENPNPKILEAPLEINPQDAEQVLFKTARPNPSQGPTPVKFLVYVLNISKVDDAGQNFTANVFLRLRWKDPRLANPNGPIRRVPLEKVWNPQVLIANQLGRVARALPEMVQVQPDGTVIYIQRFTGKFSQELMLANFPTDTHTFAIQFVASGHRVQELTFQPEHLKNISGGAMAEDVSLPDWKILSHEIRIEPYTPLEGIHIAAFAFQFVAERHLGYYLWQVVLPMVVVVVMSWTPFWVGRQHINVRIPVAASSILTLIAYRFILAHLLPKLPYMTRLDYFTVGSTLLVLLSLIGVMVTAFFVVHDKEQQAQKIDHWARGAFPAVFFLLLIWFLVG